MAFRVSFFLAQGDIGEEDRVVFNRATYVFQGFIQGKDYGQFGLQRLGKVLIFIFM